MPQITFSKSDCDLLQSIIACVEYELEDVPVKPKGWSYADYLSVFSAVSHKFGKNIKADSVSVILSETDQTLLRRLINVYVEHYSDLYDDPISPEKAEALRELYSILS